MKKVLTLVFVFILPHFEIEAKDRGREILSAFDLKEESSSFREGALRWQCFDKKHLKYSCSYVYPLDQQGSSIGFEISTKFESHSYSHGHAISGEICKELLPDLARILGKSREFCILGTLDEIQKSKHKNNYSWSFYRIKTKSGYVHYVLPDGG